MHETTITTKVRGRMTDEVWITIAFPRCYPVRSVAGIGGSKLIAEKAAFGMRVLPVLNI